MAKLFCSSCYYYYWDFFFFGRCRFPHGGGYLCDVVVHTGKSVPNIDGLLRSVSEVLAGTHKQTVGCARSSFGVFFTHVFQSDCSRLTSCVRKDEPRHKQDR